MPSPPDFLDAIHNRTGLLGRRPGACCAGGGPQGGPPEGRRRRFRMIVVFFLIGALALLVTVLLFGFVGCGVYSSCEPRSPGPSLLRALPLRRVLDYPKMVLSTRGSRGVLAPRGTGHDAGAQQWRRWPRTPSDGFHGDYFKLDPVSTPDDLLHSPATTGGIILGVTPGLLELKPQDQLSLH